MPNDLAIQHLLIRLRPINRALRAAVERQAAEATQLDRPDLVPYCITDEQVTSLLDHLDALSLPGGAGPLPLTPAEQATERQIRKLALTAGVILPLDELAGRLGLTDWEQQALLLCAAPELDRAYERVIAYVLDDLNRRFPCIELLTVIAADSGLGGLAKREVLSRSGRLRLLGLLTPCGEAPTELRQELRAPSGVIDFLLGNGGDLAVLAHDPGAVPIPDTIAIPPQLDSARLKHLGKAIRAGEVDLIGVWGSPRVGQLEAVYELARAAGMPLRQAIGADIEDALNVAAALGAILWLRTNGPEIDSAVTTLLTRSRTPVCLTGSEPWRPTSALAVRGYAEMVITVPSYGDRVTMWARALPELEAATSADLAARYRVSGEELRAIAALTRGGSLLGSGQVHGHLAASGDRTLDGAITQAVSAVTCGPVVDFAHVVTPRRGPGDLVLPPSEHQLILELAAAYRTWPRVCEEWGFGTYGNGGVKALFIGESGTGKTLAAEVIAGMLGLTLLRVDLSQIVSKWVGETEKNLEVVFRQAENSQAVLFFDEADVLFGKRGDVKQGIDRYANLEVGFLLQRLEQSSALIILASNLKKNLDDAFTRRFHYIIHFPRPQIAERKRIWRQAFPSEVNLADDVDFSVLSRLDMTGAAICGAARTAALLAADTGCTEISMIQITQGVGRQYQREARFLRPDDLGGHAGFLYGDMAANGICS